MSAARHKLNFYVPLSNHKKLLPLNLRPPIRREDLSFANIPGDYKSRLHKRTPSEKQATVASRREVRAGGLKKLETRVGGFCPCSREFHSLGFLQN